MWTNWRSLIVPRKHHLGGEEVILHDGRFVDPPRFSSNHLLYSGFSIFLIYSGLLTARRSGMSAIRPLLWSLYYPTTMLIAIALLVCMVVVHETIHIILVRTAGAKPKIRFLRADGRIKGFVVSSYGKWMSRNWYLTILLSPAISITLAGFGLIAALPEIHGALVWTLAAHLWGCASDIESSRRTLELPRCTLVEDAAGGFRYRCPGIGDIDGHSGV